MRIVTSLIVFQFFSDHTFYYFLILWWFLIGTSFVLFVMLLHLNKLVDLFCSIFWVVFMKRHDMHYVPLILNDYVDATHLCISLLKGLSLSHPSFSVEQVFICYFLLLLLNFLFVASCFASFLICSLASVCVQNF